MNVNVELVGAIAQIVFAVISAVASAIVIPWLKSSVLPWLKEKQLYSTVQKFVQAAEKLDETGVLDHTAKKDYVIGLLRNKGYTINGEVEALIESAVKELDMIADSIGEIFVGELSECDDDCLGECTEEADG